MSEIKVGMRVLGDAVPPGALVRVVAGSFTCCATGPYEVRTGQDGHEILGFSDVAETWARGEDRGSWSLVMSRHEVVVVALNLPDDADAETLLRLARDFEAAEQRRTADATHPGLGGCLALGGTGVGS